MQVAKLMLTRAVRKSKKHLKWKGSLIPTIILHLQSSSAPARIGRQKLENTNRSRDARNVSTILLLFASTFKAGRRSCYHWCIATMTKIRTIGVAGALTSDYYTVCPASRVAAAQESVPATPTVCNERLFAVL
jgi:hypothetical protein